MTRAPFPNEGAKWLRSNKKVVSSFGEAVAHILDVAFVGIYHIEHRLRNVKFDGDSFVNLTLDMGQLALYDSNILTVFVVMGHDMGVNVRISPKSHATLAVAFCESIETMPALGDHAARIRQKADRRKG